MNLDITKTLSGIEKLLKQSDIYDIQNLQKAYEQTLRLRSQLISVIYDNRQFVYEEWKALEWESVRRPAIHLRFISSWVRV